MPIHDVLSEVRRIFPSLNPEEQQAVLNAIQQDDAEHRLKGIMSARTSQPGNSFARQMVPAVTPGTQTQAPVGLAPGQQQPVQALQMSMTRNGEPMQAERALQMSTQQNGAPATPDLDILRSLGLDPDVLNVMPQTVEEIPTSSAGPRPGFEDPGGNRILQGILGAVQVLGAGTGNLGVAHAASGGANEARRFREQRYADYLNDLDSWYQATQNILDMNTDIRIANAEAEQGAKEQTASNYLDATAEATNRIRAEGQAQADEARARKDKLAADAQEVLNQNPELTLKKLRLENEATEAEINERKASAERQRQLGKLHGARAETVQELGPAYKKVEGELVGEYKRLKKEVLDHADYIRETFDIAYTDEQIAHVARGLVADDPAAVAARKQKGVPDTYIDDKLQAQLLLQKLAEIERINQELIDLRGYDEGGNTGTAAGGVPNPYQQIMESVLEDPSFQIEGDNFDEALQRLDSLRIQ